MQCNKGKRRLPHLVRGFAALCAALAMAAAGSASAAPTETVLHSFTGSDGRFPTGRLIADRAGNLYGTTTFGGGSRNGVVFKLSPGGTETVLYTFCSQPSCTDGATPLAGLLADHAGILYGTTQGGGASGSGCVSLLGCGVVFKLSPGGIETVLHSFAGSDGANPGAGLIADRAGNLYGTTDVGGASGIGVVFKLSPSGTETVLHSFAGSDGTFPVAVIADRADNLYGTTQGGGASNNGVVFKLSPSETETVLYSFTGGSDGSLPEGLIADRAGNLYGTTRYGGAGGCFQGGVVFKLSPSGTETVLHSFRGRDGASPLAGLIADRGGNLYGTTRFGGAAGSGCPFGCGVVFKLTGTGFDTASG